MKKNIWMVALVGCMALSVSTGVARGTRNTKLIDAVMKTNVAGVKKALAAGANPNATVFIKQPGKLVGEHIPLLVMAFDSGESEQVDQIAKLLIRAGADVNAGFELYADKESLLHGVVRDNNVEFAKLLLRKGARVNAKNEAGETPLDVAQTQGMKRLLRAAGAK